MRYYKFFWDESRGDAHDDWGTSWWFFEVTDDGYAERQLERYASGVDLMYERSTHIEDQYGGLAEKPIDRRDWPEVVPIDKPDFEAAWSSARPINREGS